MSCPCGALMRYMRAHALCALSVAETCRGKMPGMPSCDARYDVIFNDGTGRAPCGGPRWQAVVDMDEDRLPDDWGDPGPLRSARLARRWSPYVRNMEYGPARGRMALWIDGYPRITRAYRLYLRWAVPDTDPSPHDDPDWVIPP